MNSPKPAIIRDVAENIGAITSDIAAAAGKAARAVDDITLIAVAKRQPLDRIERALAAGHRIFGENRLQEAQGKWPALKETYPDIELHMIGALQTNKAADAMALFDVIHTLDREKLARKIADEAIKIGHCPDLFIQVNTGAETQKGGIALDVLTDFVAFCWEELNLPVIGLMCLPPIDEEPALHFALLQKLAKRHGFAKISMGMSGDFEKAIQFGATHIRVGTAVFGVRES